MNILNKETDFLLPADIKLLRQIKGNAINGRGF
jgi:hypothetical protein